MGMMGRDNMLCYKLLLNKRNSCDLFFGLNVVICRIFLMQQLEGIKLIIFELFVNSGVKMLMFLRKTDIIDVHQFLYNP